MRRLFDWCILVFADLWVIVATNRQWRELRRRQRGYGVDQVKIAVPQLADEKFLWRKVFDHDPRFVTLTDKIACKEWIASQGVEVKTPKTLWVGTDAHDIPEDIWAQPIYIKGAHGCGMNISVLTPTADRAPIIERANDFLTREHGRPHHEWAYRKVPRRLLVEEVIFPGQDLIEVKYYTNGEVVESFMITRNGKQKTSGRWRRLLDGGYALHDQPTTTSPIIDRLPLPPCIDEGLELASIMGAQFDQMRVDMLTDGETVYLGELTVYNQAGRAHLQGHVLYAPMNRSWDIRKSWFLTTPQTGWRKWYAAALRRALDRLDQSDQTLV